MFKKIKIAALSAVLGLGTFAAIPATTAQASGVSFELRFGYPHYSGYSYYKPGRHYRPTCTPNRAVNKAARMGLRHVYVRNNNRNRIRVEGRKHGDRVRVTFAKAPGCPVINYR
jgi:hypothetical protein